MEDLRAIVLDRPCDLWSDPTAQTVFRDLVSLKLDGFGKEYNYGVLPIDSHDFTSTHIILARETEGRLQPLTCCRVTTARRARMFNLPFPGLSLCAMAASPYHASALQSLLDEREAEGKQVGYVGLWTILPEARKDRALVMRLRLLLNGIYFRVLEEYGVNDLILGATMRFKLDKDFSLLGFEPLQFEGRDLPPIQVAHLLGERVLLMRQRAPSEVVRQLMEAAEFFWEHRLVLAPGGRVDDAPAADRPAPAAARAAAVQSLDASEARVSYHTPLLYAQQRYGQLPPVPSERLPTYLKAVLALLGADAAVSPMEHRAFVQLLRLLGVAPTTEGELRGYDWKGADLKVLLAGLSDTDESRRMLYDAIQIASVDGFDREENAQIGTAARLLGVPDQVTAQLVDLVRQERALDDRKRSLLNPG